MDIQKKKITKMSDELLKFYLNKNTKEISINVLEEKKHFSIESKAKIDLTEEEIEYIISNFPKHKDIEYDSYWELMGEYCDDDELELLFLLADSIHVYYEKGYLIIYLKVDK